MVYKNLLLRFISSILFLVIYINISLFKFDYVFYLIILIYIFVIIEILVYFIKYKIIPLIYVFISFIFFILNDFNETIFISFNLFLFSIITFDTFSYLIGKLIGKNQLIKVSPNKTVEGFFGGFIISLILSIFLLYYFEIKITFNLIVFILLIISSGFFGDILQSYFKRKNNIKNSSKLIPGHGGVFDRFDSFLFSIIFYSISINFLLWTLIYLEALEL